MKHTLNIERQVTVMKIALTGKLRAGKDEVAQHLYIRHGFERFAFADELKRTLNEVFPWMVSPRKQRALTQQYGEAMCDIDPQVWIKHAERKVNGHIRFRVGMGDERIGVVITDLRKPAEYDWCRANGFTVIRVTAPDDLRIARAIEADDDFTVHDLVHPTELAIDGFEVDYEVVNDGSVAELQAKVDAIVEAIY